MADFHHPKLRLLKGDELTHQELDNNINSFYYSSSLDGSNIKLYAGSTSGSFSGYTQSYDVNAFTASHAVSASYISTASYALFAISSSVEVTLEHSSSYAESASFADSSNNALSASHFANGVISASVNLNTLTLRKADNSTLSYLIHTGSGEANPDGLLSSSAQIATDISGSLSNVAISALNAGIVSASAQIRDRLVSAGAFTSASNASIRTTLGTNQFILSGSKPDTNTLRLHPAAGTNLDYVVGGEDLRLQAVLDLTGSILTETGSVKTRLNTIEAATSSYALIADISGSGNVRFEALNAATSSYALKTDISGSGNVRFEALNVETGSVKNRLNTIEAITGSILTETGSVKTRLNTLEAITGSLFKNAALSGSTTNTIRFTQQDDSTIDITINTGSGEPLPDGVVSSSAQIDHDSTTNFVANEHIDHSSITIGSGKGLDGGGTIATNRSLSLDTGSVHFQEGVELYTSSSSFLLNTTDTLTGNLTVTGDITANKITTNIVTSSIAFTSGSNIFGDNQVDKHMFTGSVQISQSLDITGSLTLNGVAITTGSVTVLNVVEGGGINVSNSNGVFTVSGEPASATNAGIIELASTSEMTEGVSTTRAVTPANYTSRSQDLDVFNIPKLLIESGSVKTRLNTIEAATSSYATKLGMDLVSGSGIVNAALKGSTTNTITFTQQDTSTIDVTINTGSAAVTNLSKTVSGTGFSVNSSTGTNVALSLADTDNWGLMSDEMFDKLGGIEALADVTDATNVKASMPDGVPSGSASQARSQIGAGTGDGTVDTSGSPVDNDFAKFTDANTVEGRSYSEVRSDLGLGTIYSKDYTATVSNGSGDIPDGDAVYDHVTSRLSGYVNKSGTPASQQIAIFTDADTISGSTNLKMHVNGSYPQFNGLQVGDGGTSNLYLGNAIEPNSANKGARFHSDDNDFYFDFQGDATQNWFLRDYDGSGGIHTRFTFDFINSNFSTNTATFTGNVTANNFVTTSDRELKKDIEPIKEGLSILKKFVSYEYELEGNKDAGFIAQEVQESLPYAVHKKDDGYLALDTKPILAHMHKAILEIDQRLSAIEEKLK